MAKPIALTDDQLMIIMRAAEPLQPHDRSAFLILVATRLNEQDVIGDWLVSRVAREAQAEFWRRAPQVEQRASTGSFARPGW